MRNIALQLAICTALLSLVGCDKAWRAYEQIELGKPLPQDHLDLLPRWQLPMVAQALEKAHIGRPQTFGYPPTRF